MYKQISDLHLSNAQAYAKLAEMEQIAIQNKQVAEEAQAKVEELNFEISKLDSKSDYLKMVKAVFAQASVSDFKLMVTDIASVEIPADDYDTEEEYLEALEYQKHLATTMEALLNIRESMTLKGDN